MINKNYHNYLNVKTHQYWYLIGEMTSARKRLKAHVESHPKDKQAYHRLQGMEEMLGILEHVCTYGGGIKRGMERDKQAREDLPKPRMLQTIPLEELKDARSVAATWPGEKAKKIERLKEVENRLAQLNIHIDVLATALDLAIKSLQDRVAENEKSEAATFNTASEFLYEFNKVNSMNTMLKALLEEFDLLKKEEEELKEFRRVLDNA